MLEAKIYDNDDKKYLTHYFKDMEELYDFVMNNNVTLISKRYI